MFFLSKRLLWIVCGLLFCSSFAVYYSSLNYDFLTWDTRLYVLESPMIRALTWENLWRMLISLDVANWHPLTWFSYAIDYALYGFNPWGFHLTNTLWHSLNTIVFFLLSLKLLKLHNTYTKPNRDIPEIQQFWIAALAALWFGIHPQHVESVVWIAERKDVLCFFFSLLAIMNYLNYGQFYSRKSYVLSLLCFCLALLAKPMAVTLPVVLLLFDVYPLQRTRLTSNLHAASLSQLIIEKIPFFIGSALDAWFTVLAQGKSAAIVPLEKVSIALRIVNAFDSVMLYLSKLLMPINLSPLYPLNKQLLDEPMAFLAVGAVLLMTALVSYAWYKRHFVWMTIWLFYVISLLPVLGLVQVGSQAAADRYAYLTTLPFYLVIATGFSLWLFQRTARSRKLLAGGGILLITAGLSYATVKQNEVWKNDLVFWSYVISFTPEKPVIWTNIGNIYFNAGDYAKAEEIFTRAINLQPQQYTEIHYNLAQCYRKLRRFSEASDIYLKLIQYHVPLPASQSALYYEMGSLYIQQGKFEEARAALETVLRLDPTADPARQLLQSLPAPLNPLPALP